MGKEEKLAILKSCVGMLFSLAQEMKQKLEYAKEGIEENNINLVIAVNFARIFRQNMFNCGLAAISLSPEQIDDIFATFAGTPAECKTDLDKCEFTITNDQTSKVYKFEIAPFDLELVKAGGWVAYADKKY